MKLIKRLLIILLISASVYLGYFIKQQGTGFVLVQYQEFSIETSLFAFTGLLIVLFIILYALLRSIFNLVRIPGFITKSYYGYQNKKSSSGLISGLREFTEGRFNKAENIFIKQVANNKNSFLNYLLAARAAQLLHADNRRDKYLKQAHEINPDADIAIGITQAELQLSHQQNEMALATLNQLITLHPKHDYVMRLMSRAYLQLEDWSHLCPLLKDLRHSKSLPDEVLIKSERIAFTGYLKAIGKQKDSAKLESVWMGMPKYLRNDIDFISLYATQLIKCNQIKSAEVLLRERLNKNFTEQHINLYCDLISDIQTDNNEHYFNTLLESCEKWLRTNPHHATLLLTAGKISAILQLWGKARSYFDSSLSSQPSADTYLQIALLLENTNESESANEFYKKGLLFNLK